MPPPVPQDILVSWKKCVPQLCCAEPNYWMGRKGNRFQTVSAASEQFQQFQHRRIAARGKCQNNRSGKIPQEKGFSRTSAERGPERLQQAVGPYS